jgi:hypothetical protein
METTTILEAAPDLGTFTPLPDPNDIPWSQRAHDPTAGGRLPHPSAALKESIAQDPDAELILKAALDLQHRIELARRSPLHLLMLCFRQPNGAELFVPSFYLEWDKATRTEGRILFEAPRGVGKSAFMIAAALWAIGNNQNIRIKWIGPSDGNAQKRLAVIHEVLDNPNHIYHLIFPGIEKTPKSSKRKNNQSQLNLKRTLDSPDPTIEALGVMSSGVGGRSEIQIWDDYVSESNTILNPAMRPKVLSKMQKDHLGTLLPKGVVWNVFTPWSQDDANAYFKENTSWKLLRHPHGIDGDPYHSIFPQLWPSHRLRERRADMGEHGYAAAYLLRPSAAGVIPILPQHLRLFDRAILNQAKILAGDTRVIITIDPARGEELDKGALCPVGISIQMYVPRTLPGDSPSGSTPRVVDPTSDNPDNDEELSFKGLPFEIFQIDAFECYLSTADQPNLIWHLANLYGAHYILVEREALADLHTWLEQRRHTLLRQAGIDPAKLPVKKGIGAEVVPVSSDNLSKGQRLLSITPYLHLPEASPGVPAPPVMYFHPRCIRPRPEMELLHVPNYRSIEVKRDLREQTLSFPAKYKDIIDAVVHGVRWIVRSLVGRDPYGLFVEKDQEQGPLQVISLSLRDKERDEPGSGARAKLKPGSSDNPDPEPNPFKKRHRRKVKPPGFR